MSYRKKHVKHKINTIRPKTPLLLRPLFWILSLSSLMMIGFIYTALFYPGIQASNISVSGNSAVGTQELQDFIAKESNITLVNFLGITISTKSILFVNSNSVAVRIAESFPSIESAAAYKRLPGSMAFEVKEREKIGVFCNEASGCFSIDKNGVIFEKSAGGDGIMSVFLRPENSVPLWAGKEAVRPEIMLMLYNIKQNLQSQFKVGINTAVIEEGSRITIVASEGWKAYFDLKFDKDIASQLEKLDALLKGEISEAKRKKLQYIDLRFKDKAYYK